MFMDDNEPLDINKLNRLYQESESCDKDVFAEMRSNINLLIGKHYNKLLRDGLARNLRDKTINQTKRVRLVENHTARAISDVRDILASLTPGVLPYPANPNEASSQKAAELSKAVWDKIKEQNDFEEFIMDSRQSHTDLGEAVAKIYFDPMKGGVKGYEQKVNDLGEPLFLTPQGEETNQPGMMTPDGQVIQFQPLKDETKPIMRGQVVIKKIEPYNLLRPKSCKKIKEAPYLIHRDMVEIDEVKARVLQSDEFSNERKAEIIQNLQASSQIPFKIFDGTSGAYQESVDQVEIREFYFRQCSKYPEGYFFITTDKDILYQGPLPFGEQGEIAFPIKWTPFLTFQGSCRGFSLIKHLRPAQAEVNRLASSQAETSLTLGPDKVLLQVGGKFSNGIERGGVRQFFYSGEKPTIIPGRSGEQYVPALERAQSNIYRFARIPENASAISQNFDPKAELFKNQRQKARFTEPAHRYARFLKDVCETSLFLAQKYLSEDDLIPYVGKVERINIPEFKNIDRMEYSVKLEEVSDDIDSMMAKQLELETILQYRGKDLDEETAAAIISQFPILNKSQAMKHLTMTSENIQSDILALDRGEYPPISKYDDHAIYIRHLTNRMKQKDFADLPPEVKANYQRRIADHDRYIVQANEEIQRTEAGFIPTGGALSKADLYVNNDPENPTEVERAVFPTESLQWLRAKLNEQGLAQERLEQMGSLQAMADVAQMMNQGNVNPQMNQGGISGPGNPGLAEPGSADPGQQPLIRSFAS